MKAIVYKKFGNAGVLELVEETIPTVKADQVLVKMKVFSINPMDWKIRKGEMKLMSGSKFPKHTGADFAGIVEDIGSAVTGIQKGDEVFGVVRDMMKEGVSAEYVVVPASLIWKKPSNISFAQAAAIPVVGTAAVTALNKMGNIGSETSILINGATGGFGMFLLQLLKQKNATVTAVTNSKGMELATTWGADLVIDYAKENVLTQNTTYDIVIDLSGKMGYKNARHIMKPKAIFLNPTPKPIDIPLSIFKNLFRTQKHVVVLSSPSTKHTSVLLTALKNGLQVEVNKVFPFADFQKAYQYAEQGGYIGKVLVEVN